MLPKQMDVEQNTGNVGTGLRLCIWQNSVDIKLRKVTFSATSAVELVEDEQLKTF